MPSKGYSGPYGISRPDNHGPPRLWTPDATVTETQGIKTAEKHNPEEVHFLFLKRIDLLNGDVLQVKESHDLWEVVDTEDQVQGNTLIYLSGPGREATKDGKRKR